MFGKIRTTVTRGARHRLVRKFEQGPRSLGLVDSRGPSCELGLGCKPSQRETCNVVNTQIFSMK